MFFENRISSVTLHGTDKVYGICKPEDEDGLIERSILSHRFLISKKSFRYVYNNAGSYLQKENTYDAIIEIGKCTKI